jgi:hypothetical protein
MGILGANEASKGEFYFVIGVPVVIFIALICMMIAASVMIISDNTSNGGNTTTSSEGVMMLTSSCCIDYSHKRQWAGRQTNINLPDWPFWPYP